MSLRWVALAVAMTTGLIAGCRLEDVHEIRLSNGLTVLTRADASHPVVTVQVWVRVGSVNEAPVEYGMAHFFEHLIFKGSPKYPQGTMTRLIESRGGHLNAATSKEFTYYYADLPAEEVGLGLDTLLDAVQNASFPPDEVERERKVILEEIARSEDNPGHVLWDTVYDTIFTTAYRHRILGSSETIRSMTRDAIRNFHRRYYRPNNMTVVVVGDVREKDVLDKVKELMAGFEPGTIPPMPVLTEPGPPRTFFSKVSKPVSQTSTVLAWPAPSINSADSAALDVAAAILGQGRSSRLYQNVREKKRLALAVGASNQSQRGTGVWAISLLTEHKEADLAREAALTELAALLTASPGSPALPEEEIGKAKTLVESSYVMEHEAVEGQGTTLGYFNTIADWKLGVSYLDRIHAVTVADVIRVGNTYLQPEQAVTIRLVPPAEVPQHVVRPTHK